MINKITLLGRCGKDARVGVSQKGINYASVSIATSTGKNESTWFDVIAFDKQSEWLAKAVKGDVVYVEGPVSLSQYQGKDGQAKTSLQVTAYSVRVITKNETTQSNYETPSIPNDSDVPF